MSEADTRATLRRRLRDLHAKSIENRCEKGTPDMTYIYGWLELKWLRGWPVKGGPVTISHYTIQQRLWLRKHWSLGGRAFLGLVAHKEWFLWAGCDAGPVGTLTREELYSTSLWHSPGWNEAEFRNIINMPRDQLDELRKKKGLCDLPLLKNFSYNAVAVEKTSTKRRRAAASAIITTFSANEE
jgi:hypothetical protein